MMVRRYWLLVAFVAGSVALVVGCGASDPPAKSLTQQYQEALKTPDAAQRARRLVAVAEKQEQAADLNGVSTSLVAARQAAQSVKDPASQASSLVLVAGAYARLEQNSDQVRELLRQAAAAIERVDDPLLKVRSLASLATATSQHLQNFDAAVAHLARAEESAAQIQRPADRAAALGRIAAAYDKSQRPAEAERLLDAARALAGGQTDARTKADCLAEVAGVLATMRSAGDAQDAFAVAQQAAEAIEDPESRAYALVNIARKARGAKQPVQAKALLAQAQSVALKIKDASLRRPLLEEIDAALRQQ
jgi:hypothetical protein